MRRYRAAVRTLFALVFVGGGVSHVVAGRVAPDGYAAYGGTAAWGPLARLWESFVMPHIGALSLGLAACEIAAGVGLAWGGRPTRVAAAAILGFFAFILVLGYGFATDGPVQDFLVNRAFTLVMAAALAPVLSEADPPRLRNAWRRARTVRA